jgi:hypothetical protein
MLSQESGSGESHTPDKGMNRVDAFSPSRFLA